MLKTLKSQHRNIIQMNFSGFKNREIAEKTGLSPTTITQVLSSPLGKAYLNGLNDRAQENTIDVRKKLISLNNDALGTLERILNPKQKAPFNVQLTAAKDVLDRNGYKPSDKFEVDVFSHKTDDEIEAEIRAMEAAIARNQIAQDNNSLTEALPPSSDSGAEEEDEDHTLSDSQEVYPFTLDKSAETAQATNAQPDSSLAASKPTHPNNSHQFKTNISFESLPNDLQAKLNDESFDPFQNI